MTLLDNSASILTPYQNKIEKAISAQLGCFGDRGPLRDACEYSLRSGGKRFRPALVYMVAESLEKGAEVDQAALAVEFFHTASLIADDLPCMDDDDERRARPALHKAFDEATALLASYALISAGYDAIARNSLSSPFNTPALCSLAIESASYNTGVWGATGGQYLDLYPPQLTEEVLREVIAKKTVSLFELSFVLGWLFGGGSPDKLPQVKNCSGHFGMAFQIADDLQDVEQDQTNDRMINTANLFGKNQAIQMLEGELAAFFSSMRELGLSADKFDKLSMSLLLPT